MLPVWHQAHLVCLWCWQAVHDKISEIQAAVDELEEENKQLEMQVQMLQLPQQHEISNNQALAVGPSGPAVATAAQPTLKYPTDIAALKQDNDCSAPAAAHKSSGGAASAILKTIHTTATAMYGATNPATASQLHLPSIKTEPDNYAATYGATGSTAAAAVNADRTSDMDLYGELLSVSGGGAAAAGVVAGSSGAGVGVSGTSQPSSPALVYGASQPFLQPNDQWLQMGLNG